VARSGGVVVATILCGGREGGRLTYCETKARTKENHGKPLSSWPVA
jgi:hypothetical protein